MESNPITNETGNPVPVPALVGANAVSRFGNNIAALAVTPPSASAQAATG